MLAGSKTTGCKTYLQRNWLPKLLVCIGVLVLLFYSVATVVLKLSLHHAIADVHLHKIWLTESCRALEFEVGLSMRNKAISFRLNSPRVDLTFAGGKLASLSTSSVHLDNGFINISAWRVAIIVHNEAMMSQLMASTANNTLLQAMAMLEVTAQYRVTLSSKWTASLAYTISGSIIPEYAVSKVNSIRRLWSFGSIGASTSPLAPSPLLDLGQQVQQEYVKALHLVIGLESGCMDDDSCFILFRACTTTMFHANIAEDLHFKIRSSMGTVGDIFIRKGNAKHVLAANLRLAKEHADGILAVARHFANISVAGEPTEDTNSWDGKSLHVSAGLTMGSSSCMLNRLIAGVSLEFDTSKYAIPNPCEGHAHRNERKLAGLNPYIMMRDYLPSELKWIKPVESQLNGMSLQAAISMKMFGINVDEVEKGNFPFKLSISGAIAAIRFQIMRQSTHTTMSVQQQEQAVQSSPPYQALQIDVDRLMLASLSAFDTATTLPLLVSIRTPMNNSELGEELLAPVLNGEYMPLSVTAIDPFGLVRATSIFRHQEVDASTEELTVHVISPYRTLCERGEQYRAFLGNYMGAGSWQKPQAIGVGSTKAAVTLIGGNKLSFRLPFFMPLIPNYDLGTEPGLRELTLKRQHLGSLDDAMSFRLSHDGVHIMTVVFSLGTTSSWFFDKIWWSFSFGVYSHTEHQARALSAVLSKLLQLQAATVRLEFNHRGFAFVVPMLKLPPLMWGGDSDRGLLVALLASLSLSRSDVVSGISGVATEEQCRFSSVLNLRALNFLPEFHGLSLAGTVTASIHNQAPIHSTMETVPNLVHLVPTNNSGLQWPIGSAEVQFCREKPLSDCSVSLFVTTNLTMPAASGGCATHPLALLTSGTGTGWGAAELSLADLQNAHFALDARLQLCHHSGHSFCADLALSLPVPFDSDARCTKRDDDDCAAGTRSGNSFMYPLWYKSDTNVRPNVQVIVLVVALVSVFAVACIAACRWLVLSLATALSGFRQRPPGPRRTDERKANAIPAKLVQQELDGQTT
jgi:hypothetical protein